MMLSYLITSCSNQRLKDYSLEEWDIPLTMQLPPGSAIELYDLVVLRELTIVSTDFSIQAFVLTDKAETMSEVLHKQREKIEGRSDFLHIPKEWEGGFLFSYKANDDSGKYGLRHLIHKDSLFLIFKEPDGSGYDEGTASRIIHLLGQIKWN